MNKCDLSKAVYEAHGGLSYESAQKLVDLIFDVMKMRLMQGEKVVLSGFGSFRAVRRKDKRGVNPQTGEPIIIPGRMTVVFKPSRFLKSV